MSIRDLSKESAPSDMTTEILIIGSGCAGATAARVFAQAGRQVIVLEEGGDFTAQKLTQRDAEMYDQLYMDRGGRVTTDLSISILQGRVLGGGGVINASDVVPISDELLRFWQKKYALDDYAPEKVEPYRKMALEDLRANQILPEQLNQANKLLQLGAQKLKLRGEVMMHNRQGCAGLGTCLIGCPLGAKKNPRWVSIPAAIDAGAAFLCRARATRIEDARDEIKRVTVRVLDEKGYQETHTFTIRAKFVIIAANAVGSTQLVLRSGIGNAHAGKRLSLQPQLPVVARFDEDVIAYRGIPQAFAVTEGEHIDDEHGLWGYRIEAIMGTPGIVASLIPRAGADVLEVMKGYNKLAASLVLVPDDPSATVGLTASGRPKVEYDHLDNHKQRLREGAKVAARCYLAAGAREVELPLHRPLIVRSEADLKQIDDVGFEPATAPLLSAHQQGGLRMATTERDGACAPDGRLYGTRGVYCFDSGIFPTSSSSHTQAPIIAVAHMLSAKFLAEQKA